MTSETLYSILYLEINLFSILLVLLIRIKTLGLSRMVAQRNFSIAIDSMSVFFASDTIWVLMMNGFIPSCKWAILLFKDIYFLSTSLMCFAWFVYFEYLQDSPFVKNSKRMVGSAVFVIIQFILIIVNHFTGILYYVDESGTYFRGPFFLALYTFLYIYVIFTCVRALISGVKLEKSAERRKLLQLASFPIFPAIGGVIQFLIPSLPVVCGMLALATLQLYLDWTGELISVDPLTRLNNRKQLLHTYEQWLKNNDEHAVSIHCLMMDANRFKEINDTYGHVEGDAALVRVADALRRSCKEIKSRPNIARYGCDEFVILAKAESEESIAKLKDSIHKNLHILNEETKAPYELTVSIGAAKTDSLAGLSFKDLAALADEELYEQKKLLKESVR